MKLLLVDDEPGIREGLAALLRRKGHVVEVAADCAAARAALATFGTELDLVLTDWRLPDGVAADFLAAAPCPAIAMSGHPEEAVGRPGVREVLTKPVAPARLLVTLTEALAAPGDDESGDQVREPCRVLPQDVADLVQRAGRTIARRDPGAIARAELLDDGTFVTLRAPVPDEAVLVELGELGGDQRVLAPAGAPLVELRWCRNGRPELTTTVVAPAADWPREGDLAVDFGAVAEVTGDLLARAVSPNRRAGEEPCCSHAEFGRCLDRAADRRARGQGVHFLNVPRSLLSWTSDQGREAELPMRAAVGPRIPAVLADLWS